MTTILLVYHLSILRYFQFNEGSQGWRCLPIRVPTDQVPCKTIGISNLHCALHTHMLTNAKSVNFWNRRHTLVEVYISQRGPEKFRYDTNFLLDENLKIGNAGTLTYIETKRIMIFSALYLCMAKRPFITTSLVLKAYIVLNISGMVL